jgi:hypothetical protein
MVSGDSKNFVFGPPSFFGARDIILRLVLSDALPHEHQPTPPNTAVHTDFNQRKQR